MDNTIKFVNVNFPGNVGDFYSTPLKYYNFKKYNIEHVHYMDMVKRGRTIKNSLVVIGGGGLLFGDSDWLRKPILDIIKNNKVIFWGVGHQTHGEPWGEMSQSILDILDHPNVLLKGVRDIWYQLGLGDSYTPCVSCKHSLFDQFSTIEGKGIGCFEHTEYKIPLPNLEKIDNSSSLEKTIEFLASKEVILTNSYHGVYWSQLLGKKVLYFGPKNVNSKFIGLKYRVNNCNEENYLNKIKQSSRIDGFLEESRNINNEFYSKVIKIIDTV